MSKFTNTFHTLHTKKGIKDSKRYLVVKYCGALHRYIQTRMGFLGILSLGSGYRYAIKIKQKSKLQNKREFRFTNSHKNNQPQDK
jgi:hypothetical protein